MHVWELNPPTGRCQGGADNTWGDGIVTLSEEQLPRYIVGYRPEILDLNPLEGF